MADPLAALIAISIAFATAPAPDASLDPGPHPECPSDMRLVTGEHHDEVQHYCVQPHEDIKATKCFGYWEGLTALEGPTTDVRVCMDQFEAPNKKGARPYVMKSFKTAKKWCEQRGKRTCTEQEWETACEGPQYLPYAYGWSVEKKTCNSDKAWLAPDWTKFGQIDDDSEKESQRLWQGAPSGRYSGCVSVFGVYDMNGNVEEWVSSRKERKWPGALMGGFWAKPWTGCRGTNDAHQPSFVFYETGFRCCADPGVLDADGKPRKKEQPVDAEESAR